MLEIEFRHRLKSVTLDVSFQVDRQLLALFGPSGAGKSATLQMIAGLMQPEAGRISLNGQTLFDSHRSLNLPPQQRRVGYVMQDYTLFPHLSVAENIAYGLRRNGSAGTIKQAVADMLALIQLPGFGHYRPHELSGGQQQRVALARALVTNPQILLLDEPFSALDGPTRAELRADLRDLLHQVAIPTLLVTHDLAEANLLADQIAVYDEGKILQIGPPPEIMHRPSSLTVARLTGLKNCFRGEVQAVLPDRLRVRVGPLLLNTPRYPFTAGQPVQGCLRPEQVILLDPAQPVSSTANVVKARVEAVTTDGLTFHLQLCLIDTRLLPDRRFDLVASLPLHTYEALTPAVGQVWPVCLKQTAIHLISDA